MLHPQFRPNRLRLALRAYGVAILGVFLALSLGWGTETHLLAEHGGALNWTIWNDVHAGDQRAFVPPMLFAIYITWAIFLLRAAPDPLGQRSFLVFTLWANLAHGLLMVPEAASDLGVYWSKFFTDIPFILGLSLVIYLWGPQAAERPAVTAPAVRG